MSSHSRALDGAGRLAGELVVDAIFLMRRKPSHWPVVVLCTIVGFVVAAAITGSLGFFTFATAAVAGGFGINIGSDFRFIACTHSRLLLFDSSRVIAQPTRLLGMIDPGTIALEVRGVLLHVDIDGERHVTARQNAARIERMMPGAREELTR